MTLTWHEPKEQIDVAKYGTVLSMNDVMEKYFIKVYEMTGRNKTETAKILKVGRTTIYKYVELWIKENA